MQASPFDIVFEAAGTSEALDLAARGTRIGGTVVVFGIIAGPLGISGKILYEKELTLVGSRGAGNRYEEAVGMLASGGGAD